MVNQNFISSYYNRVQEVLFIIFNTLPELLILWLISILPLAQVVIFQWAQNVWSNFRHQYSSSNLKEEALQFWHHHHHRIHYRRISNSLFIVNFVLQGLKLCTHIVTCYLTKFGNRITVYVLCLATAILNTHHK